MALLKRWLCQSFLAKAVISVMTSRYFLQLFRKNFPKVVISATPADGEDLAVLQFIVDFVARAL